MQSAFPGSAPIIGTSGHRFSENIRRMSDGRFEIKFFEPGALVPALECFDSVSKGAIESCWTTPGYHAGKIPALVFFSAVPFGPQYAEFLAWMKFGGGDELRDDIYARHGLVSIDVIAGHPETSGWFKGEVKELADLQGKKIRFFGMGGKVLQKLGVSTQLIAAGDIYPALERGVIDATEFATPALDINFGFYKIAKYNEQPAGRLPGDGRNRGRRLASSHVCRGSGVERPRTERDAHQAWRAAASLDRRAAGRVRAALAGGARGGVGKGPAVQEGSRQLPRVA
jgi:TRAP-type mannitol/chloroaromatic compound transport system substrate-binding protein